MSLLPCQWMFSLCFCSLLLLPTSPRFRNNAFLQTCHLAAQELNETDCWVCSNMPTHQGASFDMQALPADISLLLFNGHKEAKQDHGDTMVYVEHQVTFPVCFIWPARPGVKDLGSTTKCMNSIRRSPSEPPAISGQLSLNSTVINSLYPDKNSTDFPVAPILVLACRVWKTKNFLPHTCPFVEPWGPPEDVFWVCGSAAYKQLPTNWSGSCALGHVVPAIRITKDRPEGRIRNVREVAQARDIVNTYHPLTDLELYGSALLPIYGVVRVGWAIYRLQAIVDLISNETATSLELLASEQRELRRLALQNRMALDIILASHGGACALIGSECCVFVPDVYSEVFDHAKHIAALGATPVDESRTWLLEVAKWFQSWWGKLATYLIGALVGITVIIIGVKVMFKCIFSCTGPQPATAVMVNISRQMEHMHELEDMTEHLIALYNIEIN